ncbi:MULTISPECIES: molybdenum cofactor guanylyltransferase [Haloarcula]|uniref:molybdenum cofactor guanylyltransferase n=1 Tax=Haloarcula TaxID=2237 RepID=UPI0023ED40CC|nr:molybdenum cofactor guanylyltransferase [Halomicroarcula sp. XH51]
MIDAGLATPATGVVVAGGRGRRFGDREKALAPLGGRPMLDHVVGRVGSVTGDVVVNCRADQREAFAAALSDRARGVRFAVDERPDEGPLTGLRDAFRLVETEYAVAVACDMPLVEPPSLAALLERVPEGPCAVVPTTADGPEPLHAVYPVAETIEAAGAALDDGERSLRAVLRRLPTRELDVASAAVGRRSLTSVDTPADVAIAARRFDPVRSE